MDYLVRFVESASGQLNTPHPYEPPMYEMPLHNVHHEFVNTFTGLVTETQGVFGVDSSQPGVVTVRVDPDRFAQMRPGLITMVRYAQRTAGEARS